MLAFDRVSKRYPTGSVALSDVSFQLARGELAFLTGPSGAGKSTLLKLILAMEQSSGGRIHVAGQDISRLPRRAIPGLRRRIGAVFQDPQLIPDRSVADNVALPLVVSDYPAREIPRRVRAALDKVGLLHKEKVLPASLSGGEQQRVGIARAVVHRPSIILADEPTGNLDPGLSAEIMTVFQQFRAVGVCLLVATHEQRLVDSLPGRQLRLVAGRLSAPESPFRGSLP